MNVKLSKNSKKLIHITLYQSMQKLKMIMIWFFLRQGDGKIQHKHKPSLYCGTVLKTLTTLIDLFYECFKV